MNKITPIEGIGGISPSQKIDFYTIHKVLSSGEISNAQKAEFIKQNSSQIQAYAKTEISKTEFEKIMEQRPLVRFKPIKNSFTKKGDEILLAQALGIDKQDIKKFIEGTISSNFEIHNRQELDRIETTKSYVYRHGTKKQVVAFLEYELSDVKNILTNLYKTLNDDSSGIAGYFSRPIHRMDNNTLISIYKVIDKSLNKAAQAGEITQEQLYSNSRDALIRIYQIQNNSKLIRALEVYNNIQ